MEYDALCQRKAEIEDSLLLGDQPSYATEDRTAPNHWDFVVKESLWLSEDFVKERTRHQNNAKKHTKGLETFFKTIEQRQQRKAKIDILALRKISNKIAKDIKKFWSKIDRVVAFTQKIEADEVRQKAMDKHLKALIDLTEKYSFHLAKNMHRNTLLENKIVEKTVVADADKESCSESHSTNPRNFRFIQFDDEDVNSNHDGDESFGTEDEVDEMDNESTFLEQEAWERENMQQDGNGEDELTALQREGEMSIEELRALYSAREAEEMGHDSEDCNVNRERASANTVGSLYNDDETMSVISSSSTRAYNYESTPCLLASNVRLREYQSYGVRWLCSMEAKGLNGILADEMGLGKTLQTIVMLANLAVHKGIWGPHLVIAPTSCIVNWESELKRFCPAFKVLTYFGSAKARKLLRQGWSKLNSFHICITSYQLVVHDANAFRRKKWYYMILDEAHNIKNFKSKRWQTLMNFDSFRRLLLTGTPLQNNLMELWSLMHFLMPHIFQSRKEFAYWFSNPLESALEQAKSVNNDIVGKLHNIIRPFILRRLKADVAQQLPKKFEHIRFCKLSKRQKLLYEEFINTASSKTKAAEKSYLAMMNLLMQLRKVCDHPDLVEPRLIGSPYCFEGIENDVICKFVRRDMQIVDSASIFGDRNLFFWEDLGYCEQLPLLDLPVPPVMTASQDWVTQFAGVKLIRIYHRLLSSRTMYNRRCLLQNSQKSFRFIVAMMQRQQFLCSFGPKVSEDDELASVSISALSHLLKIPYVLFRLPKVISTGIRNIFVTGSSLDGCNAAMFRQHLTRYIEFPDKKMVQFDSGKLVELYRLLYEKKRGGHKCLIFTQMSRMLDILELFLNLHDFSFVRLDGSTSVEDRQKLMDRFNADPKLFCFILSTRSGGLGVNLTGADTVIFYDTDWNPAMDAQAQDRAHRIGQTREVHIYRLVSEGTIEENILRKAQQRRDLDSVVINKGKFSENSLMTMNSLQSMFNLNTESTSNVNSDFVSQQEMEAAMLAAEDVDDVAAIQVVQNEVDDNEKLAITTSDEVDPSGKVFGSSQNEDKDLADIDAETVSAGATLINDNQSENVAGEEIIEAEFEALRRRVGDSIASIQSALSAIDRYAVKFRSQYDVFVSPFYVNAQSQLESLLQSTESEMLHIADYEKQQIYRDQEAMENGEIIYATPESADLSFPEWYVEKRRAKIYERKLRAVSGQCWIHLIDNEGFPFWQNSDTGAFSYTTPAIITLRDNIEFARLRGFAGLPISILVHVFSYLISYPDRNQCALVCAKWLEASRSENLLLRVFPIESGIRESDKSRSSNIYSSIQEAVENSHAGDTILLYRGHYWEKGIELRWPLRIVSYVSEIGSCIIELTEQIIVLPSARVCIMQGLSLRCAGRLADVALVTAISCRLMMDLCSCENWSPFALTLVKVFKTDFFASRCRFSGGNCGISANESTVLLARSLVERSSTGINGIGAQQYFVDCVVRHCSIAGFNSENDATVIVRNCEFRESSLLGQIAGINNFVWKNNVC